MDPSQPAFPLPARTMTVRAAMPDKRGLLRIGLKLVLAGAVLCIVASVVDLRRSIESVASAPALPLLLAALLVVPNLGLQHAKWLLLARNAIPGLRQRDAARSLFIGFSLALVTPARAGEFGGRAYALHAPDPAAVAGLTALDKLASMIVTLSLGIAGCVLYAQRFGAWSVPLRVGAASAAAVLVLLAIGFVLFRRHARPTAAVRRGRITVAAFRALSAARIVPARTIAALLGLSLVFYLVFIAQFVFLLRAIGGGSVATCIAGAATVMLLKTIIPPLTFGELGIREGVTVFVFAPLGVAAAAAFDASILLFALNVLLPALVGTGMLLLFNDRRPAAA